MNTPNLWAAAEPPKSLVTAGERLFVLAGENPARLFQISPLTGAILREIPIPDAVAPPSPCGLALYERELYLTAGGGRVIVIESDTGKLIRSFNLPGNPVISGLAVVYGEGLLVSSVGSGGVSSTDYYSPLDGSPIRHFPISPDVRGLGAGPLGRLFGWNSALERIEEIHEQSGALIDTTSGTTILARDLTGLAWSGRNLFVSDIGNSVLKVVDPRSKRVLRAFPPPLTPVCALAAGPPLRPEVLYVPPVEFPKLIFGSFHSRSGNIASGGVFVYPDETSPASAVEMIHYDFSGEFNTEVFSASVTAASFPSTTGVFHLYGVGVDNASPSLSTDVDQALEHSLTLILDSEGPDLVIASPEPDRVLNANDTIPGTTSFSVFCFANDFPAGIEQLDLLATPEGGTPERVASAHFGKENSVFIEFVWTPPTDGPHELFLMGRDAFQNISETDPRHVVVDRSAQPPPGDPLPTTAEILFSSPPLEIFSTVTLAELDGDPEPEFVFGTDRTGSDDTGTGIYAINHDTTPVAGNWPVILNADVRSSPAVADLDRDGLDEIVVGTYGPPHTIRILDQDGTQLGQTDSQRSVISSPAIGNLDSDPDLEIVVGTSDGTLLAMEADGSPLNDSWPVVLPRRSPPFSANNDVDSSPAIGDITGDGTPEILAVSDDGILYAYDTHGNPVNGFPFIPPAETFHQPVSTASNFSSPVLADVDGDGLKDVVVAMSNGRVYGLKGDGTEVAGFPIRLPPEIDPEDPAARDGDDILSTPALGDVDGDGLLELAVAFHSGPEDEMRLYVFDLSAPADCRRMPWPQFQEGGFHQGLNPGLHNGDVDRNGVVDIQDGIRFVRTWYRTSTMPEYEPLFDMDYSKRIDSKDLLRLLEVPEE